MPDKNKNGMNAHSTDIKNILAWDRLYARTRCRVWGDAPATVIKEYLRRVAPELKTDSNVLDAATGEGRNLPLLLALPGRCFACDTSERAMAKIPEEHRKNVSLTTCNLSDLPYPAKHFSLILLWDTIETLPSLDDVLRELSRVIRPEGYLLCNIPDEKDGVAEQEMTPFGENANLYRNEYFYRFMTREQSEHLLSRHGFEVTDVSRRCWTEAPHPEFRQREHAHESLVYLARKTKTNTVETLEKP